MWAQPMCGQRWINSSNSKIAPDLLPLMANYRLHCAWQMFKIGLNWTFWYDENNHINTTKILSVRSSPDPPIFKKIAVRSSPVPAKIGFSPDPVRSGPDPCSSLVALLVLSLPNKSNPSPNRYMKHNCINQWDFCQF